MIRQAVFASCADPRVVFPTLRPVMGNGCSLELQRTPPALIHLPVRRWHVVTLFLSAAACQRMGNGRTLRFRTAAGSIHISPAGAAETVTWPDGVEALHLHIDPTRLSLFAGSPVSLTERPNVRDDRLAAAMRGLVALSM